MARLNAVKLEVSCSVSDNLLLILRGKANETKPDQTSQSVGRLAQFQ